MANQYNTRDTQNFDVVRSIQDGIPYVLDFAIPKR